MSVIGPRPGLWNQDVLTAERDKYGANDIKPGLTGWAQINGRDELEIPEKAKLDGEYVQKMGFIMDGMAVTVPNELEYQYGMASIVSVITMIIPRKIWPGKPISPIITNLHMFCGELAAKSGYAMPNISEYYLDFGVIGCIVMLFIFGQVLQKLKDLYRYKSYDRHGLILYSVMFPALLQVMLRGYSPSYMYLLFFYSFPVIIMKYFVDNKSLK